ncbi:hypothetical protein [Acinetobacter sp. CIP 102136]|uniref:hypothetical protein n=1 Tax=Acinetobacter sp. CIP 102136 TaxID=1144665 RepID=UPI0002CF4E76|nr:hypothetical protein [Acinetobacter sp. CIP 102136]ENX21092.1 hypothetical protein F893_01973 [Acinetobacter sp. CIP 102136]
MAVPEQTPYIEHTGNGATTSFALKFQCETKDHLIVLVDDIEPPIATWSLTGGNVVFTTAPASGSKIALQRNTPFGRTTDYQSFNNSFRPQTVNSDFDRLWLKLQELGVADWILGARIDALKNYVDRKDDELKAYLMEEIRKQGVALDQLDEYYNYLMQRLAQIAVDKGWDASFVVYEGKNLQGVLEQQENLNAAQAERNKDQINARDWGILPTNSPEVNSANWFKLNNAFPERGALDIFVPIGNYKFSEGFFISRPHCIRGVGSGENCKTIFNFAGATPVGTVNYKAAVFFVHGLTWDDAEYGIINKPQGQIVTAGTGAVLENIAVINSSEHGIIKNAPCNFFGVATMRNAKHGILTTANVDPTMIVYGGRISGIANQGANVQCASLFNGKSGFAEFGSDANVINNDTCLAAYNSEFGFYGGNLLGSVHTSCQAHANTLGDYAMQGGLHDNSGLPETPASNLYNGCYAEGQRDSTYSINARSLVISALGGRPQPDTINYLSPSIVGLVSKGISAATSAQHIYDGKGGAFTKVGLDGIKIGSDAVKTSSFDIQSNALGRVYLGSDGNAGILFFLQDFSTTLKANRPWLNGLSMGNTHSQTVGTAAPTTGAWDRGNIVWNESPTAGGKIGWVCVAGGSPGVWRPFGAIDA